jgi:hypothetical protein
LSNFDVLQSDRKFTKTSPQFSFTLAVVADLQNGFLDVFEARNTLLALSRNELTQHLQTNADVTQLRLSQTLTSLRNEEQRLQTLLDQEDGNSTCIQSIQSFMENTLSLSGFRLVRCATELATAYRTAESQVTDKVLQEQLATHKLPYLVVMSEQNLLLDKQIVDEELQAQLKEEQRIAAEVLPRLLKELAVDWGKELETMNQTYENCSNLAVSHFQNVILALIVRINGICNA